MRRLRADAATHPDDEVLAELLTLATAAAAQAPRRPDPEGGRVLCPHFRIGGHLVRTISVVAQFGAAVDVTLEELRLELIYPADEEAAAVLSALG
ncbi:MAG: hypothetical protein IPL94_00330 [Tetrasphaera sp.]|nr:hypothetical protein [Tetrasphaera sp.]